LRGFSIALRPVATRDEGNEIANTGENAAALINIVEPALLEIVAT
jgi:hypothetical protein